MNPAEVKCNIFASDFRRIRFCPSLHFAGFAFAPASTPPDLLLPQPLLRRICFCLRPHSAGFATADFRRFQMNTAEIRCQKNSLPLTDFRRICFCPLLPPCSDEHSRNQWCWTVSADLTCKIFASDIRRNYHFPMSMITMK